MGTQLDKEWAKNTLENVQAMIFEIERLEARVSKYEVALGYFSNPEVYQDWEVNGQKMEKPVLVNGMTIAQDAFK
jgi:hypothetical protein